MPGLFSRHITTDTLCYNGTEQTPKSPFLSWNLTYCFLYWNISLPLTCLHCHLSVKTLGSVSISFLKLFSSSRVSQAVLVVKSPPADALDIRDEGSIPGSGKSPGGGRGNPLQYSCLENPMDKGAWWATVHSVPKCWTQLKQLSSHASSIGDPFSTGTSTEHGIHLLSYISITVNLNFCHLSIIASFL